MNIESRHRRRRHDLPSIVSALLLALALGSTAAHGFGTSVPYLRAEPGAVTLEPGAEVELFAYVAANPNGPEEILAWTADGGELTIVEQPRFPDFRGHALYQAPAEPGVYTVRVISSIYPQHFAEIAVTVLQGRALVLDSDPAVLFENPGETSWIRVRMISETPIPAPPLIRYGSSDPSIVRVTKKGKLKAMAEAGAALITVSAEGLEPVYVSAIIGSLWETTLHLGSEDVLYVNGDRALLRSDIPGLAEGRILISGIRGGLLSRVSRLDPVPGGVLATLEPAGLPDAYRLLRFELESPPIEVSLRADEGPQARGKATSAIECEVTGPQVVVDPSFGTTTVSSELALHYLYELGESGRPAFAFWVAGDVRLAVSGMSLGIDLVGGATIDCFLEGAAIPIPIIPGPITVGATIKPALGFEVSLEATSSVTFNAPTLTRDVLDIRQGFGFNGEDLYAISSRQDSGLWAHYDDGTPPADLSGELSASLMPYGKGTFGLGLVAGPTAVTLDVLDLRLFGYGTVSIEPPLNPNDRGYPGPYWGIGIGADGSLGPLLDGLFLDKLLELLGAEGSVDIDATLFDARHPFLERPPVTISSLKDETTNPVTAILTVEAPGAGGDDVTFLSWPADDPSAAPTLLADLVLDADGGAQAVVEWPDEDTDVSARVYDGLFGANGFPYAPGRVSIGANNDDDCAGPTCEPTSPGGPGSGGGFGDPGDSGDPGAPGSIGGGGIGGPGSSGGSGTPGDHGGDGSVQFGSGNNGHTSGSTGDPHVVSFDGLRFNYQGAGEFILAGTTTAGNFDANGDLQVQVRQRPVQPGVPGAINTAAGIRLGSHTVAIYANPQPGDSRLYVDGVATADPVSAPLTFVGEGAVYADGSRYTLVWPDGSRLRVNVGYQHLDAMIYLAPSRLGGTVGLLGVFDGDRANDLTPRDGQAMAPPINYHQLYDVLGESWRVPAGARLLDPSLGDGDPTDPQFPGSFPPADIPPEVLDEAEERCEEGGVFVRGVIQACRYDVALLLMATPPDDALIDSIIAGHLASQTDFFGETGDVEVFLVAATATVPRLTQADFFASVHGTPNTEVTWQATGGSIDSGGTWTAPAELGDYVVIATSVEDPTRSASVTVTVTESSYTEVYATDFEAGPVDTEWSFTGTEMTPVGARTFLGQLNNDAVTLSLSDLPAHAEVMVTFDLYLIRSWDGNSHQNGGPDVWSLSSGGVTLLETTFSNLPDEDQAYPDNVGGQWPYRTGASEIDTLGYDDFFGDCVQRITRTFDHTGSTLVLEFEARDLEAIVNESWGLDNVMVLISD